MPGHESRNLTHICSCISLPLPRSRYLKRRHLICSPLASSLPRFTAGFFSAERLVWQFSTAWADTGSKKNPSVKSGSHALSSSIHYNMVTWSLRTADKAFQRSLEKIFQTLSKMETVQSNRISFKTVALDEHKYAFPHRYLSSLFPVINSTLVSNFA